MGLDAFVFCDCYEKGKLRKQPPYASLLIIRDNGSLDLDTDDARKLMKFDKWCANGCKHEEGILAGEHIGNISYAAYMRRKISKITKTTGVEFPIIWGDIIYSGTHCGDHIPVSELGKLKNEIDNLKREGKNQFKKDECIAHFIKCFEKLIDKAIEIKKPIAF